MKVTILGSGPSSGVPTIHDGWVDCDPENPRNRRLRPSILVEDGDTVVLVDTSPDLRRQLRCPVSRCILPPGPRRKGLETGRPAPIL